MSREADFTPITRQMVEDAVLMLADIIEENRCMRAELKFAKQQIREYQEQFAEHVKEVQESDRMLLKCILEGCFNTAKTKAIIDEYYEKERMEADENQAGILRSDD